VEFKHFHEKKIAKISDSVSALAVSCDGEFVACLDRTKISVFRLNQHGSFFSIFKTSHAPRAITEISTSHSAHPLSLATPLDAVRLFWPAGDVLVIIDERGSQHKFHINLS
jgi:hypothetical protein